MIITLTEEIQRLLPPRVRKTAGFKAGDQVEVKAIGGIVTFIGKPPNEEQDDEYTPAQRRAVKAEISEAHKGPTHGPFQTAEEFAAYFKAYKRRRASNKPAKTR